VKCFTGLRAGAWRGGLSEARATDIVTRSANPQT